MFSLIKIGLIHNYDGSVEYLKRLAKLYNQNVDAFTNDGELVAWILRHSTNPLCALQTTVSHRDKDAAQLVTKFILKRIASLGHDEYAEIIDTNTVSKSFLERLVFKAIYIIPIN